MITIGPKGTVAEMQVSTLGFGAMGLTAFYGDLTPEKDALVVLRKAFDLGVRHFDTAQMYRRQTDDGVVHFNEELVGKFLKTLSVDERKDVTVATKYYPSNESAGKPWSEEYFIKETDASRKRLGVDIIDLYYFHRTIPEAIAPVETWVGAAAKLVGSKIKRIGLSEASPSIIRRANAVHPITCVQQEWSIFARDLEKDIVPTCRELGIGIIAYSPIGRGFLAGSFLKKEEGPNDWRANIPYMNKANIEKNLELLEEIKAMAEKKHCTTGQLCLAWLMAQGAVPIPGTTRISHLEDNMGAVHVELTEDDIIELGDIGNKVTGNRGDAGYMSRTFHTAEKADL